MLFDRRQGMKFITGVHGFWYRLTGGLVGGNVFGTRVLLLTTIGRKSGKRYTTPLTYLKDGDNLVIIASNGGADTDPDWWRNLKANPLATVQVGPNRKELHAGAAVGSERDRLWAAVTTRYPIYRRYEGATKREIPVVVLRPQVSSRDDAPDQPAEATSATVGEDVPTWEDEGGSVAVAEGDPKKGIDAEGAGASKEGAAGGELPPSV
jgi:deazaflavin-dependent oxidoreductase (nitroreductase family)